MAGTALAVASKFLSAVAVGPVMRTSRGTLLAGLVVALVVASGCLGVITGSQPAVFTASRATVSDAALGQTQFQYKGTQTRWLNRTVTVAGQQREVNVSNQISSYERPVGTGANGVTFGIFVVVATPQAQIAGQALNPIGRMSPREMVDQLASGQADVSNVHRVDDRTLTVLGTDTQVVRFGGDIQRAGQRIPVYLEVTRVGDGGDFVVALGAYPQATADQVRPDITTLFQGVTH